MKAKHIAAVVKVRCTLYFAQAFGFAKAHYEYTWYSRLFTMDLKHLRVNDSEQCLQLFWRNKKVFFMRFVLLDETWIYHYTAMSNRQFTEWRAEPTKATKHASVGW